MKLELCSPTERDSELGHHLAVRASKNNRQQGIRVSKKNPADCRNFPIAMASLIPSPVLNTPLEAMVKSRDVPHHWNYLGLFFGDKVSGTDNTHCIKESLIICWLVIWNIFFPNS